MVAQSLIVANYLECAKKCQVSNCGTCFYYIKSVRTGSGIKYTCCRVCRVHDMHSYDVICHGMMCTSHIEEHLVCRNGTENIKSPP